MKKISIILSIIFFSLIFCGCAVEPWETGGYSHPDFETKYTEEEHVQRISARTEEKFAEELKNGTLVSYDVEIVYAFYDNDPEYFLVNLEYAKEQEGSYQTKDKPSLDPEKGEYIFFFTKYKHIIGFINKDIYYCSLTFYYNDFHYGQNCYELCGYKNAKKYYGGGHHGVKTDEGVLLIYDNSNSNNRGSVEFPLYQYGSDTSLKQYILSEEEQKYLMKANYKWTYDRY